MARKLCILFFCIQHIHINMHDLFRCSKNINLRCWLHICGLGLPTILKYKCSLEIFILVETKKESLWCFISMNANVGKTVFSFLFWYVNRHEVNKLGKGESDLYNWGRYFTKKWRPSRLQKISQKFSTTKTEDWSSHIPKRLIFGNIFGHFWTTSRRWWIFTM